jgi:hypothetical protein
MSVAVTEKTSKPLNGTNTKIKSSSAKILILFILDVQDFTNLVKDLKAKIIEMKNQVKPLKEK